MKKQIKVQGVIWLLAVMAALGLGLGKAQAQQRPQYSQYMFNQFLLNPAVAGTEDYLDVKAGYRRQWVGIEGAPETYYLSANGAIGKLDRNADRAFGGTKGKEPPKKKAGSQNKRIGARLPHMAVGGIAQRDKTGPLSRTGLQGAFAVHVPLSKQFTVAGGVNVGVLQYSLNVDELRLANPDPALGTGRINRQVFDMGLGTWAYSNEFFVGVSLAQVLTSKVQLTDNTFTAAGVGSLQNHWFITGGYQLDLAEDVSVIPSVLVKIAAPAPVSADFNLKIAYMDRVWLGGSYRTNDAFSVLAGGAISPLLTVGYAYDITTSKLNTVSNGSHEIVLGLRINNPMKGSNWRPWW